MKKAFLALAVVVTVAVAGASQLLASSSRSGASTITIDDRDSGGAQCSGVTNDDYKHHDALVNAMNDVDPGGTIRVCPGKYDPVVVDQSVTIIGNNVTATSASQCITPSSVPATDATKYAIVDGQGTQKAIDVSDIAGPVKIQGLTIQNGSSGVYTTAGTTALAVVSNVIQNNTIGISLNGGGPNEAKNKVQKNCIRRNNMDGTAAGNGIYSEDALNSGKIELNTFYKNNHSGDGGAINLAAGNPTNVEILSNTSNQDANFVSATGTRRLIVNANTATGTIGGAVWLDGDNQDAQITKNTFNGGHDDGIGLGSPANTHVLIFGNTIKGNATDGIDTSSDDALTGSSIGNNTVQTNGTRGIALLNLNNSDNFVTGNTVSGNGDDVTDNCLDTDKVLYNNTWFGNSSDCKP